MSQEGDRSWSTSIPFLLVLLLVLVSLGLRLAYVTRISLYIDEFTSIWAAKLILERGLPLTPAGVVYHRGILFSYVMAISAHLFGSTEEASRLASVFIAAVTVPCLYLVGKRMFSVRIGLLAAAFLSFAPQAIVWGGRARMYALLQLLSLLAVYFLYAGVVESKRDRYLWMFVICFCGAIFSQEQAILLYPALLLAVITLGRWRWLFQRRGILTNALCCLAILGRYLLDLVGRPTQFELIQAAGPSAGLTEGLMTSFRAYLSFFLHPDQLLLAILFGVGAIAALREIADGRRDRQPENDRRRESLVSLYLVFALTVLEMLIAGGARWSDPRYFFMVLPLLILGASSGLDRILASMLEWLTSTMPSRYTNTPMRIPSGLVCLSLVGLVAVTQLPGVVSVLSQQIEGHDRAMEYVRSHWSEGDVILTASPPVCAYYLDRCDYYAMQTGYEGYVIDREGQSIDVWTGAPHLNSTDQLTKTLQGNDRVWFVVDGWRLSTRFELDFLQVLADQMDTVEDVQGVKILRSDGYEPPGAAAIHGSVVANLEDKVALVAYDLETDFLSSGETVCLTLYWQALAALDREYTVFVHLLGREGSVVGQDDRAPMGGLYPTINWQEGQIVPDRHCLTPGHELAEDRYLLEVGMYVPETAERLEVIDGEGTAIANRVVLDYVRIGSRDETLPAPSHEVGANLAGQVLLLGYDLGDGSSSYDGPVTTAQPGNVIPLTIHWRALAPIEADLTVFLHVVDQAGHIWGQDDGQPDRGFYPTSYWAVGEVIMDERSIMIDASAPAGQYRLVAGMYVLATDERLSVMDEVGQVKGDTVYLGAIEVERI